MITRCMFDLYHGDSLSASSYTGDVGLFAQAKAAGWPMMVHKLTQGTAFVDNLALGRLTAAHIAGLMLGVYHFVTSDPVASQAAYFMHQVGLLRGHLPGVPILLVIDNEPDPATSVTDAIADQLVVAVKAVSGKFPLLYGNRSNLFKPAAQAHLLACQYWLAEYGTNPVPPAGYGKFPSAQVPFHQYSGDGVGPSPVNIPGIGVVDQSEFNGSLDDLAAWFAVNAT